LVSSRRVQGLALTALLLGATPAQANLPIQAWTLPNGARVLLVHSPTIPMVDVQIDMDAGSRRDPADKAGRAQAMADLFDKGAPAHRGQVALDENAVSEAWADLGASFGANASADRLSFGLRSLTESATLSAAAALAARQLAAPAWLDAAALGPIWQRDRQRWAASLREAQLRPATVAGQAFGRAVFGSHPYGHEVTAETLARIELADLAQAWGEQVRACGAVVSVVGALQREAADQLVRQLLAGLPDGSTHVRGPCAAAPAVAEVAPLTRASEQRVPFDSAQAHVLVGQPGFARPDRDFFALTLGNYVLGGGGFVSRLSQEVREKRGLSYSVYSYFAPGRHAGAFTIGLQTRPDQADAALSVVREVLARYIAEGPTDAELQAAKDNLIGGFALRLDSNRKLLDNIANIGWNRLPLDYLTTWREQVRNVSRDQVTRAMQRVLQPERMVTVIVGAPTATR
jgi:zinc protease